MTSTCVTFTCYVCRQSLPADRFHNNRSRRGGKDSMCKSCRSERDRARYARMTQEKREARRIYFREQWYPEHRDEQIGRVIRNRQARRKRQSQDAADA